jgi:hypothetical protein
MLTNKNISTLFAVLIAPGLLTACSSVKTYQSEFDNNLHITTKTDSSVDAAVDIYKVEPDCSIKYSGTISLNKSIIDTGIPSGRSSYLVFSFSSSSFFSGSSTTSYSTLLRPRAGLNYDISVSYIENIYNVVIHEKQAANKSREIEAKSLADCRPL